MKPVFQLLGHRGARSRHPENTIEGFQACLQAGITAFETDIAITKDGVAVLHHDARLNSSLTCNADRQWISEEESSLIKELDWNVLQSFNVGAIKPDTTLASLYPEQIDIPVARVPKLADLLALPVAHIFIELKIYGDHPEWTVPADEMVRIVLQDIENADAQDRVTLQSFQWDAVRLCRDLAPELPRAWLTDPATLSSARKWGLKIAENQTVPDAIAAEGGGTWTPRYTDLTYEDVRRAHAANIPVVPWTVNDLQAAERLMGWGVDGLISDDPLTIQSLIRAD